MARPEGEHEATGLSQGHADAVAGLAAVDRDHEHAPVRGHPTLVRGWRCNPEG